MARRILWQTSYDSAKRVKKDLMNNGYIDVRIRKLKGKYFVGKDSTTQHNVWAVSGKK